MTSSIYNIANCYVCNDSLGLFRNSLNSLTSFTETYLSDTLEHITGANLDERLREKTSVCQECFITLERYDELQKQQNVIQDKVTALFHRTHSVQVYIKQEQETAESESSSCVKIKCQKCNQYFSSLKSLAAHNHDDPQAQTRSQTRSQSKLGNSQVSKEFVSSIKKQRPTYDCSEFQRAFFSKNEKKSLKSLDDFIVELSPSNSSAYDPEVSESFKTIAEENGIDYNINSFRKAFGYSENESIRAVKKPQTDVNVTSKGERWTMGIREKVVKPPAETKVNHSLVRKLKAEGIDYNLKAFQKAFGFDQRDCATQNSSEATQEEELELISVQGYLECKICKARFTHRQRYNRHIRIHEVKDINLYCEECSKSFKSTDCLKIHIATDHGRSKGEVECPICLKTCIDAYALRSHYYIHKTERSFLCGKCGATFVHKKSFVSHMMMHEDLRPFDCTVPGCSKKFRNNAKLKIHIRVHTGEKIYECPLCPGRKFAQKWGLDLHTKKQHSDEIPHRETCQICNVRIHSKSKLKIHMAKVHQVLGTSESQDIGMETSE